MTKFIETTEIPCVHMTNLLSLLMSIYCQNVTGTAPPSSFDRPLNLHQGPRLARAQIPDDPHIYKSSLESLQLYCPAYDPTG